MRFTVALLAAVSFSVSAFAASSAPVPTAATAQAIDSRVLSYGDHGLQQLLYWPGETADAPLIAFVHGGGWTRGDMRTGLTEGTVAHWRELGFAVASINYRLVPDVQVEAQAHDVAYALAFLDAEAARLGFDPGRVVLAGHSAGAHLAALVATDPGYMRTFGMAPEQLAGVLALDGAGYDIPAQMIDARRRLSTTYETAFGTDAERHAALSPTLHAAAPNAPEFLILHVDRRASRGQSMAFARALQDAGTRAVVESIPGRGMRGHMEINRRMGESDYPATSIVDEWLARVTH